KYIKKSYLLSDSFKIYLIYIYFFFLAGAVFTEASKSAPALNFTTFLAAIAIAFPVCGFLPSLASLLETDQEPNPTNATFSPFFKVSDTFFKNDSKALLAATFVIPASAAIASIKSVLFIRIFFLNWLKN